jgi:hypothetical protein
MFPRDRPPAEEREITSEDGYQHVEMVRIAGSQRLVEVRTTHAVGG